MMLWLLPFPAHAGHDVFHIFTPAIETGHWGFEALSTFQDVPNSRHDEEEGDESGHDEHAHATPRAAHEIALHAGLSRYWMSKLALGFAREEGESYRATAIASENVFRFTTEPHGPLDFGWFTAVEAGLDSEATNAVVFGPILSLSAGPIAFVLNPFLEKTFGENREEGIAFAYGWRATYEIAERLSIGVEGYGEIENLGNAPSTAEQVHRIGPVLYLGHVHGSNHHARYHDDATHAHDLGGHEHAGHGGETPEWHAELGVLFGLTEATPDAALKVNLGADF